MKMKYFACSFIFSLLFCTLFVILLHSEMFAERIGLSETLHDSIEYFVNDFISYRQTGENIALLQIGELTLKLDLELIRNIGNKISDICGLVRQSSPEFIVSFFSDLYDAVKEVMASILNLFCLPAKNI